MLQQTMPANYKFHPDPKQVAVALLSKSSWVVLATLHYPAAGWQISEKSDRENALASRIGKR